MPNIKPITDLKSYDDVIRILNDISVDDPVFLTQEGRGRYVILDMEEYEKQKAVLELMSELSKSEEAQARGEVYSLEEADKLLGWI
ncbi:MAG: prevent-host-death protein [Firmicutes bacterium]|nr:prevent-host-death protein [[Eubacterium] siraeum]MCM1487611.1 prevent-host-death protein [Bacillota bacterium]